MAEDFFVPSKHVTSQLWSASILISFRIQLKITAGFLGDGAGNNKKT